MPGFRPNCRGRGTPRVAGFRTPPAPLIATHRIRNRRPSANVSDAKFSDHRWLTASGNAICSATIWMGAVLPHLPDVPRQLAFCLNDLLPLPPAFAPLPQAPLPLPHEPGARACSDRIALCSTCQRRGRIVGTPFVPTPPRSRGAQRRARAAGGRDRSRAQPRAAPRLGASMASNHSPHGKTPGEAMRQGFD
jgi:hypothetical protein